MFSYTETAGIHIKIGWFDKAQNISMIYTYHTSQKNRFSRQPFNALSSLKSANALHKYNARIERFVVWVMKMMRERERKAKFFVIFRSLHLVSIYACLLFSVFIIDWDFLEDGDDDDDENICVECYFHTRQNNCQFLHIVLSKKSSVGQLFWLKIFDTQTNVVIFFNALCTYSKFSESNKIS